MDGLSVDPLISNAVDEARRIWPGVTLEPVSFSRHLAALSDDQKLPAHVTDTYLAWAAAAGDPAACSHMERVHVAHARRVLGRLATGPDMLDEWLQLVREKLWVGAEPALLSYTGEKPLTSWVAILAKRCAVDALRREGRQAAVQQKLQAEPSPAKMARSIESQLEGERQRNKFAATVATALAQLSVRDRNLLRMHYGAGVSAEALSRAYGVHRSTATRWLVQARSDLYAAVRTAMQSDLDLSHSDFGGLAAQLQSEVDLAITSWASAPR